MENYKEIEKMLPFAEDYIQEMYYKTKKDSWVIFLKLLILWWYVLVLDWSLLSLNLLIPFDKLS